MNDARHQKGTPSKRAAHLLHGDSVSFCIARALRSFTRELLLQL